MVQNVYECMFSNASCPCLSLLCYLLGENDVFVLPPYLPPYVDIIMKISFNKFLSQSTCIGVVLMK